MTHDHLKVDKWQILQDLRRISRSMGLNDRSLAVLSALLTFHPVRELSSEQPLIVWPSNATLSERANGIPESTMRRHLALLVNAGLLDRHDSPNRKRYARRSTVENGMMAYGFSLRPLLLRAAEIATNAASAIQQDLAIKDMRESISLLLINHADNIDVEAGQDLRRLLRRRLELEDLKKIHEDLNNRVSKVDESLLLIQEMSASSSQNERHIQITDKESLDRKETTESSNLQKATETHLHKFQASKEPERSLRNQGVHLEDILQTYPEIVTCTPTAIDTWIDLHHATDQLAPMMGITEKLLVAAKQTLSLSGTAIVLSMILQRFSRIRNPGAYLNHFMKKANQGQFSIHATRLHGTSRIQCTA